MAEVRIVINTSALTRLGSRFRRAVETFQEELDLSLAKVSEETERAFAAAARRHGYVRVAEGVVATVTGNRMKVTVTAIDPESGYDYALVTRIGHKVQRIVPKTKKVLKFEYQGKTMYRRGVKAWTPSEDWADEAMPEVHTIVHREAQNLERRLVRKLTND